jgi:D-alanine-D-alanine ligase
MIEQQRNQLLTLFNGEFQDGILSLERRKQSPVTVFFGGNSSERVGSILSSQTITNYLKQAGYSQVERFDITRETIRELPDKKAIGIAFMTLHGGFGEDGTLQGMLEMLDIPYTGCGVAASAVSADKVLFNSFVRSLGYKTPDQIVLTDIRDLDQFNLDYPVVIKPATQGCSYGVFFVSNEDELRKRAIFTSKFSDRMVIEKYIPGRELSVGLFEDPYTGSPHVLPISEMYLQRPIQDFETKYPGGEHLIQTVIPAQLEPNTQTAIESICADIFRKLNCRGYVRMDLRLTENGEIFLLENNTSPGLLNPQESDFPKMLTIGGVDLADFADLMVQSAIINYYSKKRAQRELPGEKEMVDYLGIKLAE